MAIHHPTPPLGGGERPRLAASHYSGLEQCPCGPVTQAVRAMRAADPVEQVRQAGEADAFSLGAFTRAADAMRAGACRQLGDKQLQGIRALSRTEAEDLIGGLIYLLDTMDGSSSVGEAA